jgi:hypothetical protein
MRTTPKGLSAHGHLQEISWKTPQGAPDRRFNKLSDNSPLGFCVFPYMTARPRFASAEVPDLVGEVSAHRGDCAGS